MLCSVFDCCGNYIGEKNDQRSTATSAYGVVGSNRKKSHSGHFASLSRKFYLSFIFFVFPTTFIHRSSHVFNVLHLSLSQGIATRVFGILRCKPVKGMPEDITVMTSDYNVFCYQGKHNERLGLAIACMLIYVAGIPIGVFFVLWRNRKHLWDVRSEKHEAVKFELGGLYEQCKLSCPGFIYVYGCFDSFADLLFCFVSYFSDEPKYWWFELVMILSKMLMTGGLSVVKPGSPVQMVLAVLVLQVQMLITLKLGPFEEIMDDNVAFLSSCALMLTTLGGLCLLMDEPAPDNAFNPSMIGVIIIAINFGVIAFDLGNILMHQCVTRIKPPKRQDVRVTPTEEEDQPDLRNWGQEGPAMS